VSPYRVVIDTNLFVSSFWGGKPKKLIDLFIKGKIQLLISPQILEEISRVLKEILGDDSEINYFIKLISLNSIEIIPNVTLQVIKEDPSDNKFLECAVVGKADYIISGDKHLLDLRKYQGIPIIKVDEFLKIKG
jgi:putative PIN family toxin of toxin-antitoxin system